ncbi:MAG: helix-turn-helix domain-containing protein [Planctomycetaceae bacterium]|nr:helix-turn-helix domain-containing protein [Planctomycetaceae bacterium]
MPSVPENDAESKEADSSDATADYVVQVTATELRRLRGDSQAVQLWCILLMYADWDTGKCHPSRSTLATDMGVSTDTVDRARRRLQNVGLLATEQRKDQNGNHTSNEYTLIRQRVSANLPIGYGQPCGEGMGTDADQTSTKERVPVNKKRAAAKAAAPADLLALIDGWNGLGDSIVKPGNGARRDPPSKELLRGWRKVEKNKELQEAFSNIPKLLAAIRKASYCHAQDWFSLAWLFGNNRTGESTVVKLMRGGYDSNGNSNSKRQPLSSAACKHNPTADPAAGF